MEPGELKELIKHQIAQEITTVNKTELSLSLKHYWKRDKHSRSKTL